MALLKVKMTWLIIFLVYSLGHHFDAAVKVTEDDLPAFFAENFQVLFKSFLSFIKLMLIYLFAVEMERLSMQKKLFCVCVY